MARKRSPIFPIALDMPWVMGCEWDNIGFSSWFMINGRFQSATIILYGDIKIFNFHAHRIDQLDSVIDRLLPMPYPMAYRHHRYIIHRTPDKAFDI